MDVKNIRIIRNEQTSDFIDLCRKRFGLGILKTVKYILLFFFIWQISSIIEAKTFEVIDHVMKTLLPDGIILMAVVIIMLISFISGLSSNFALVFLICYFLGLVIDIIFFMYINICNKNNLSKRWLIYAKNHNLVSESLYLNALLDYHQGEITNIALDNNKIKFISKLTKQEEIVSLSKIEIFFDHLLNEKETILNLNREKVILYTSEVEKI